jgi:hypothetical protein
MPRLSKIGAAALAAFGWTSGSAVTASYLVVAGGAGGGGTETNYNGAGGGGAGGFLTGTTSLNPTLSYTVTVGAGGAGGTVSTIGVNGSNSQLGALTASVGGGGGGTSSSTSANRAGANGGSGGGGAGDSPSGISGGTGTSGQGNAGGSGFHGGSYGGGGGGGAFAVGQSASATSGNGGGNGGAGSANPITGSTTGQLDSGTYYLAGGGAGGMYSTAGTGNPGTGGLGGGGNGGTRGGGDGFAGTANLGGGGGGATTSGGGTRVGGQGGSGVVIISYVGAQQFGGGVVTVSGGNTIHTFTTSGTLSPLNSLTASYLVVAGGGSGGTDHGGGGGAGGMLSGSGLTIDTNSIYAVTVGAGGASPAYTTAGNNGSNSVFFSITSTGGGTGGGGGGAAGNGGSGGGARPYSPYNVFGTGISGQGNNGGTSSSNETTHREGGGGGGASAVGQNSNLSTGAAGNGGAGSEYPTSSGIYYAGGGGGGCSAGFATGTGGAGGGGNGASGSSNGSNGTVNKGGGGGGSGGVSASAGGAGGSGIVIISYPGTSQQMAGGTVTVAGGNVIHTFTSSGYLAPIFNANNSLRFRSSASANLTRTVTGANTTQLTFSFWVKYGVNANDNVIYATSNNSSNYLYIGFNPSYSLDVQIGATANRRITTQVFRDPSAWYHIVVTFDTTQATASDRIKVYVNGSQVTAFSTNTTGMSQNSNLPSISSTLTNYIGNYNGSAGFYYDGYMAELNAVYGQALTPSSFGETSTTTGVWQPKKYLGSYGTNGFYLPFTDTTSTSTLGTDFSGNSNTWTVNNISLTSGSTYDSMNDVPTLTSATTANYCVLNPLDNGGLTVTGGNLNLSLATATWYSIRASMAFPSTGKYYWEYTVNDSGYHIVGILDANGLLGANTYIYGSNQYGYGWQCVDALKGNNGTTSSYGSATTTNDVIMIAFDADNRSLFVGKNGTWFNSSNPATNTSPMYSSIPTTLTFFPTFAQYSTVSSATNFGQRPFSYTPPTGFVALNTFNLPTPTIGATASSQANKYMDVTTYTGNSTAGRVITMSNMTNVGFAWVKIRSGADDHRLANTVTGGNRHLQSNTTAAEGTGTNIIQAFSSNTFTVGSDNSVNVSGSTYVGWVWANDGTSGSTNTAGSITSTVSANTTAGFSVVTFTMPSTNLANTVGHGLGVAPAMYIVKSRSVAASWFIYHQSLGATQAIVLNSTNASSTSQQFWNNTAPTSSVFSIGQAGVAYWDLNATMVAYCFAPIAGYSAFGSYTGNGSSDGPFIFTGFRPRYVMIKRSNTTGDWIVYDSARSTYNGIASEIYPNLSNAEDNSSVDLDFVSNGIKLRNSGFGVNGSGDTYIYACFAENPFKYANAR